ncbi:MAG: cupin domain-containing protein [Geminicoccaceae bacterium]|nr:cupin domain-containing protein [Geminicoccaceae bacterium]MCX7631161.1 cupin domain-containing protein [Geminicoccaceae bacterium]
MAAVTPGYRGHEGLAPLASRYVRVDEIPWQPTRFPGIEIKVLLEDQERGLLTALFRWAPGARLPLHEHVEIEQSFVLEGSFRDEQGICRAGDYVWRPAGSRHEAWSEEGCVLLAFFLKPNRFLDRETDE